jgi:hypothetical protein
VSANRFLPGMRIINSHEQCIGAGKMHRPESNGAAARDMAVRRVHRGQLRRNADARRKEPSKLTAVGGQNVLREQHD